MNPRRHYFCVLCYTRRHNELVDKNDLGHLNPYAKVAKQKTSTPYPCTPNKRPANAMKKPAAKKARKS